MARYAGRPAMAATIAAAALAWGGATALASQAHEPKMLAFANEVVRAWAADPGLIEAVSAQNARHDGLTQADIDRIDQQWRNETQVRVRPLIRKVLRAPLSLKLRELKRQEKGLVTGILVMDAKGLNVAQSDLTRDYWQGDEAKWRKTFLVGPSAVFVDGVWRDKVIQISRSQVSLTLVDPADQRPIGVITVSVDLDQLLR